MVVPGVRQALLGRNGQVKRDPREVRPAAIQLMVAITVAVATFALVFRMGDFPLYSQWTILALLVGSSMTFPVLTKRLILLIP